MKFKVSEDVDAPASIVWTRFTDFSGIEAEATGRGAELSRVGNWSEPAIGRSWRGSVTVRGRVRPLASEITALDAPDRCVIATTIGGMEALYELTFLELRPDMTRVQVVLDLSANTLSARLALQTMKLARGRVMQRLQGYLARQGNLAEDDYRRSRA
ncbi:SRPBCC family protein [Hasllibacter sp. MH4015]|uniref:SRPBCC family protein n=1 Tax=Hasllibacter sp. MH4015 TaxID=2854029 RepID=UPI001CD7F3BF|nr:SRPBCC family protein [Hasllibacter sp. MH4015]